MTTERFYPWEDLELWTYATAPNPFHIGVPSTPEPEEPFEVLWYPTRIWNNQEDR